MRSPIKIGANNTENGATSKSKLGNPTPTAAGDTLARNRTRDTSLGPIAMPPQVALNRLFPI